MGILRDGGRGSRCFLRDIRKSVPLCVQLRSSLHSKDKARSFVMLGPCFINKSFQL